jgi:hypothetical protein
VGELGGGCGGSQSFGEHRRRLTDEPTFVEWTSKASAVLRPIFGAASVQVGEFEAAVALKNEGYRARSAVDSLKLWRGDAAKRGRAVLSAAIFAVETLTEVSGPLDDASIDPELWAHAQGLVANNDWAKVPASVAIFVEDRVRSWAADPLKSGGAAMVGKSLYAAALNDSGPLRLGRHSSECEGSRSLGVGLAQAIANVDRHRIQVRDDVRRYAMGVLGRKPSADAA